MGQEPQQATGNKNFDYRVIDFGFLTLLLI